MSAAIRQRPRASNLPWKRIDDMDRRCGGDRFFVRRGCAGAGSVGAAAGPGARAAGARGPGCPHRSAAAGFHGHHAADDDRQLVFPQHRSGTLALGVRRDPASVAAVETMPAPEAEPISPELALVSPEEASAARERLPDRPWETAPPAKRGGTTGNHGSSFKSGRSRETSSWSSARSRSPWMR